jgi:hypothetical protein
MFHPSDVEWELEIRTTRETSTTVNWEKGEESLRSVIERCLFLMVQRMEKIKLIKIY